MIKRKSTSDFSFVTIKARATAAPTLQYLCTDTDVCYMRWNAKWGPSAEKFAEELAANSKQSLHMLEHETQKGNQKDCKISAESENRHRWICNMNKKALLL